MAIKQRALRKLNTTTNHMIRAMSTESKAAVGGVCHDLEELRDLYREGLPQQDYATYGEVCDGLLLAVPKMLEDGAADVSGDAAALCKELLEYLGTETEKETHFKKEIVFLPYQASMWDSLESVWKAAYEDKEHCNAYVMPIPYADLNPDRSVAAWHCERDQFPKYVPTLDWQEIDLKEWHPDIIFYHNPYDDCNLVTSVESRYYSRNLKECADKLVYIPYFVLEEPCTEESVEHFVTTPGVLNADQVIVQSEAMRELYINILTKRTNHTDRSFWEKRISGAGSPKIEKVLTSKKEDFDMPEKWRKLVEGKKVILYNTSLSAMLQNSDKVCDKLRYVFDVFRNRDDVVLWWRPHPLMKSTFHSMRPQFEAEYLSLEKQYIEEGWGVYDDSSDLHRAIAWSDAYYGDASSVEFLYRQSGKPILRQDLRKITGNSYAIRPCYICIEDKTAWMISSSDGFAGLYEMNLETNHLKCLGELPVKYDGNVNLDEYDVLQVVGDEIIIAPAKTTRGFLIYNRTKKKFLYEELKERIWDEKGNAMAFSNAVHWGRSIFFFCNLKALVVEYIYDEKKWIYHYYWNKELGGKIREDDLRFLCHGIAQEKHKVYLLMYGSNKILEWDLRKCEAHIIELPCQYEMECFSYYKGYFWFFSGKHSLVIKYRKDMTFFEEIKLPIENKGLSLYRNICHCGDCMVLFPCLEDRIFVIDTGTSSVSRWIDLEENLIEDAPDHYIVAFNHGNEIFAMKDKTRMLQEISENRILMEHRQLMDCEEEQNLRRKSDVWFAKIAVREAEDLSVFDFLYAIVNRNIIRGKGAMEYSGKAIERCVMSMCLV